MEQRGERTAAARSNPSRRQQMLTAAEDEETRAAARRHSALTQEAPETSRNPALPKANTPAQSSTPDVATPSPSERADAPQPRLGPSPRSSPCKPRRERERLDDGHSPVPDAYHRQSLDNVKSAAGASQRRAGSRCVKRRAHLRGVVVVESPLSRSAEAMLLVVSHGTVALQTLQKPYQKLLGMPLYEVAAKVVPGRQDTIHVTVVDFEDRDEDPDAAGIFVVLRDRSLRDQWLEALATAGAHVDAAGACLAASKGAASYPDAPVRWLR